MHRFTQLTSIVLLFSLSQLFFGCSFSQTPSVEKEKIPIWVNNPTFKDNINSIASSTIDSENFTVLRDDAYKNSIISLQKNIEFKISTFIKSNSQQKDIKTLVGNITKESLKKSKILKLFQDKNHKVFVLRSISTDIVIKNIKEHAQQLQDQTLYQTILLNINNGNLKYHLQNTN